MIGTGLDQAVYVKIYANRMELKHLPSGKTVTEIPAQPFTTARLLVGQFTVAQTTLAKGLRRLPQRSWWLIKPRMVMHPMEKTEPGLSEVEERVFKELADMAGARKAVVWVGSELTDREVMAAVQRA